MLWISSRRCRTLTIGWALCSAKPSATPQTWSTSSRFVCPLPSLSVSPQRGQAGLGQWGTGTVGLGLAEDAQTHGSALELGVSLLHKQKRS